MKVILVYLTRMGILKKDVESIIILKGSIIWKSMNWILQNRCLGKS